ncbi:MAG: nuclear transport factor 2 family protein [Solirubrobacterales bacterium]
MSEQNSEIVRAAFEAFNEGGPEAFIPFTHPDVEFSTPSDLASEPDTYRGHDGVRRYWDSFFEIMDEIKVETRELHDRGERVVVAMTLKARGRATGIETEQQAAAVATLRDGKTIGITFHTSLQEAEAAAAEAEAESG